MDLIFVPIRVSQLEYRVLNVVKPELAKNKTTLQLSEKFGKKTYTYVEPTFANITEVNKHLTHKIPAEKIVDWEANYEKIVALGKQEVEDKMRSFYASKGLTQDKIDARIPRGLEKFEKNMVLL